MAQRQEQLPEMSSEFWRAGALSGSAWPGGEAALTHLMALEAKPGVGSDSPFYKDWVRP